MKSKPKTIDEYLATLSVEQREALEQVRRAIKAAAPQAEECISYDIPGFRLHGRLLVSFGAAKNHYSFYPGAHPLRVHRKELASFELGKGTVRFSPERPLPSALVQKLVRTRVAEYSA